MILLYTVFYYLHLRNRSNMQSCIIRIHIDIIVSKNRYCHDATANDTAIVQTTDDMHCNANV